jgi:hypothetical protein
MDDISEDMIDGFLAFLQDKYPDRELPSRSVARLVLAVVVAGLEEETVSASVN